MSIHPKRKRAQAILVDFFRDLNQKDPNYFKMFDKYGTNIEKSIFNEAISKTKEANRVISWENKGFEATYSQLFRKVRANLKYTPVAEELLERLRNKEFLPTRIVSMDYDDMAPQLTQKRKEEVLLMFKKDHYDPESKPQSSNKDSGMFQCGKCKSFDIETRQAQTRSADEPMTIFAYCQGCGKRWKM